MMTHQWPQRLTMQNADDDNDFSLALNNPASHPHAWYWEIYRLGRKSPIQRSPKSFRTMEAANVAGKAAFRRLMNDFHS